MLKKFLSLSLLLPLMALIFITSCETEEFYSGDDADLDELMLNIENLGVDEYTADLAEFDFDEEWETDMQRMRGKKPCFKIVFPVNLVLPTDEVVEVEDREAMREVMKAWKEANPDSAERPVFEFPFKVELKNGEFKEIQSIEQLKELHKLCSDRKKHRPLFKLCFDVIFPISIAFPGVDVPVEVAGFEEFKAAMKAWKEANPDSDLRPQIIFPIEVVFDDQDAVVVVADMEELKELLKDCVEKMKKKRKKGKKGKKDKDGK